MFPDRDWITETAGNTSLGEDHGGRSRTRCSGDAELYETGRWNGGKNSRKKGRYQQDGSLCDGRFDTVLLVEDPLLWYPNARALSIYIGSV
ncbi:MAG: hypothetical protein ACLUOI_10325 [Eisenbergiella sp.]